MGACQAFVVSSILTICSIMGCSQEVKALDFDSSIVGSNPAVPAK